MSYQKHTWVHKERITKELLNHMEEGIYDTEQQIAANNEKLESEIAAETERAVTKEQQIILSLGAETSRAQQAETNLGSAIAAESERSVNIDENHTERLAILEEHLEDIEANTAARHTHDNKALLDDISQDDVDGWHTHGNKEILDGISQDDIDKWNSSGGGGGIYYGVSSTAAGTAAKTVTVDDDFELSTGSQVMVKFAATNTASAPTLNVNSTGAKTIQYRSAALEIPETLATNRTYLFVYDGSVYQLVGDIDNTGISQITNDLTAGSAITAGSIIVGSSAGYKTAAANVEFDISLPILYAPSDVSASAKSHEAYTTRASVDLTKTKTGFTGTAGKTVFLVGTLSGSTFKIDSAVLTTTVPTSADSKYYIPVGIMITTTTCYFKPTQQLFAFTGGSFGVIIATGGGGGSSPTVGTEVITFNSDGKSYSHKYTDRTESTVWADDGMSAVTTIAYDSGITYKRTVTFDADGSKITIVTE